MGGACEAQDKDPAALRCQLRFRSHYRTAWTWLSMVHKAGRIPGTRVCVQGSGRVGKPCGCSFLTNDLTGLASGVNEGWCPHEGLGEDDSLVPSRAKCERNHELT